jgi:TolB-like protein/DNA-binding winged helix-turn-helix (wHTH) protein
MPAVEPPHRIAFDEVVIDLAGRRLLRAGEVVPLEPKAFDVLALLAAAPGQAFSRDEILDAVWGHRHVTPGVLNRVVSILRHALGDDAHHPRFVHTLHGVGYRFDLPSAPGIAPADATMAPPPVPFPVPSPWRRRIGWGLLLLAIAALALAATAWWRRAGPTDTRGPVAPREAAAPAPTLVVAPLRPLAAGDAALAAGLSDELINAIARIEGLRVIARESTALATASSADAAPLVARLGISHALSGSVQQAGEQLRVHVRLSEAASGRTLWARAYDRDVADVLALQREIAQAVATALSLQLGLSGPALARGGDAAYYRRYLAARALLSSRVATAEPVERAEAEFRALVRMRPEDARAHAGLALALETRAYRRPQLAAALRAEAAGEAALARRLDPALAEPYRVQAGAACRANRWEECLALHARSRALAPSDTTAGYQHAMALAALGYLDRAEAMMREGVARDPLSPHWRFGWGRILDTLGRHEEARAQFARSDDYARYGRWFNAVWRGRLDEAERFAAALGEIDMGSDYDRQLAHSYVATTRALRDPALWPAAEAAMRASEADSGLMNFLRIFLPGAHAAPLIDGLDTVRRRSYSTWDLVLWNPETAFLRRDPAFDAYLRRSGILAYWRAHGFPPQCRPSGDGARCE